MSAVMTASASPREIGSWGADSRNPASGQNNMANSAASVIANVPFGHSAYARAAPSLSRLSPIR